MADPTQLINVGVEQIIGGIVTIYLTGGTAALYDNSGPNMYLIVNTGNVLNPLVQNQRYTIKADEVIQGGSPVPRVYYLYCYYAPLPAEFRLG